MRKNALSIICISVGTGAVMAFCRWLQDQIAFDDSGLILNSPLNWAVALLMLGSAIWFYFIVRGMEKDGFNKSADFTAAFSNSSKKFTTLTWILGIIMVIGGIIYSFSSVDASNSGLNMLYGLLSIVCGVTLPMAFSPLTASSSKGTTALLMTLPIIQLCFALLGCYKLNSTNPTTWAYAPEILAFAASLLTYYYIAGFAYGRSFTLRAFFFALLSVTLNICCIADEINFGQIMIMLATAGIFTLLIWRMFLNLSDPESKKFAKEDRVINPVIEEAKKLSVAPPTHKEDYSVSDIIDEADYDN